MRELVYEGVQAMLIVVIPIITVFICQLISRGAEWLTAKTGAERFQRIIDEAEKAVTTAVIATSQTYVDALKKANSFSDENQKIAFDLAFAAAKGMMAEETIQVIGAVYGSFEDWMREKIEAAVRTEKGYDSLIP